MFEDQDELLALLSARQYLYTLFQSLFGNEPSDEQFAAIDVGLVEQAYGVVPGDTAKIAKLIDKLSEAKNSPLSLKDEYTRLFIGPSKLPAPPWESIFTGKESALFQRSTLEIRNFYRSQGFISAEYPHVADDHLAIELDFLAQLAGRAFEALGAGEARTAREALEAGREFLVGHLLVWVGRFTQDLEASQKGAFYPVVAQTLVEFAIKDALLIENALKQMRV
jgi:TorA maturation chaperone TorD